ncbi:MAG: hypothetical protein C4526_05305 [Nitrospiraceae bacterium]|nr:MAG: hypothetical protein C4526_05305 [Nitrospiraceae bacterium]
MEMKKKKAISEEDYWEDRYKSLKKYIKENPVRKSPYGVKKRRKNNEPIPITQRINLKFNRIDPDDSFDLTVIATPGDWKKLAAHFEDPSFQLQFLNKFIYTALCEIEKNIPRGNHKRTHRFVEDLKWQSCLLFLFLKSLINKPVKEQPICIRQLLERAKSEDMLASLRTKGGKLNPRLITEYVIEKVYSDAAQEMGLYLMGKEETEGESKNFYTTYIQANGRCEEIERKYFKGKSTDEIAEFAKTMPALSKIFTLLKN